MRVLLLATGVMVALVTSACAQTSSRWGEVREQAGVAIMSGDCARGWDLIWPWARDGSVEARAILASGMLAAGLNPPGGRGDAVSRFRHSLILAVYGSAGGDAAATELLNALIRVEMVARMGGRELGTCLESGATHEVCVARSVKDGFIPDFSDYAREIDALASARGAPEASCLVPNNSQPLPMPG
jgi:hypothetical protein